MLQLRGNFRCQTPWIPHVKGLISFRGACNLKVVELSGKRSASLVAWMRELGFFPPPTTIGFVPPHTKRFYTRIVS